MKAVGVVLTLLFISCVYSYECGLTLDPAGPAVRIFSPVFRNVPQNPAEYGVFQRHGVSVSLSLRGSLQVVETQTGILLWSLPGNVDCTAKDNLTTGGCSSRLVGDGNFAMKDSFGKTYQTTNTYERRAWTFYISSQPPYIYMQNLSCVTTWSAGSGYLNDNKTSVGSTVKQRTVADPPWAPVVAPTSQAVIPAGVWRNTLGVCVHLAQNIGNGTTLATLLNYIGGCCMRDRIPSSSVRNNYLRAAQLGTKFILAFAATSNITGLQSQLNDAINFSTSAPAGTIRAFEGFNEINGAGFGFTYNGVDRSKSFSGMFQAQKDAYNLVKNTPIFANIPVFDLTGADFTPNGSELAEARSFAGRADGGNIHPYPPGGRQVQTAGGDNLLQAISGSYSDWDLNTRKVATEDGYYTYTDPVDGPGGISYNVQAIQEVNMVLAGVADKFDTIYLYQLNDQDYYFSSSPKEATFGIFMTNNTGKPMTHALHFLSQLLFDGVNPDVSTTPNNIVFGLSGLPGSCRYLVFKKSGQDHYSIVIWNTAPRWDPQSLTELPVPAPATVTLAFATGVNYNNISVYDIYTNPASVPGSGVLPPLKSVNNANGITFNVAEKAVVVNFQGRSSSAPSQTPAASGSTSGNGSGTSGNGSGTSGNGSGSKSTSGGVRGSGANTITSWINLF